MRKLPSDYEIGDTSDHGKEIVHIVAQCDDYLVFLCEDGKPGFECVEGWTAKFKGSIHKHDEIVWKVFNCLPEKAREVIFQKHSFALANIFSIGKDIIGWDSHL